MNICIIPARGGSKRIPRKNIKIFAGKPIIEYSIEVAKKSELFSKVVVSTEDEEITTISKKAGAVVPFIRPEELSTDRIATRPVINHSILEIEKIWGMPNYICVIYPTAPFLTVQDLQSSFEIMRTKKKGFVIGAASFAYPIQRAFTIDKNKNLKRINPENRFTRSQDLEEAYHDAGQFCWGSSKSFLDNLDPVSKIGSAFKLPRYRVHDIDTIEDWERAETIYTSLYR